MDKVYEVPSGERWGLPIQVIDEAGHADSYRMKAICLNCKWNGQIRIARGQRATKGIAARGYDCPACACATVEPTTLIARDTLENDSRNAMAAYCEAWERHTEHQLRALR